MSVNSERRDEEAPVELTGVLAEFRAALEHEIDAARSSAASRGIQLFDGRRIGDAARGFQYAFRVESALNLPDDSPGELHVPGRPGRPLQAAIVAVEGLLVTVSVEENAGDFIPRATLQSDLTFLLRSLIQRIERQATRENPAGDRILGTAESAGEPVSERIAGLNAGQADAVASALGRDTTFVWGPPGTGKTYAIGRIGEQLVRAGRSVLVVSHTNSAVDQALMQIAEHLGDDELVDGGGILRLGEPRDQQVLERPRLRAETHVRERSQELLERKEDLLAERATKTLRLAEVRRLLAIAAWSAQAGNELASLQRLDTERRAAETAAAEAKAAAVAAEEEFERQREIAALANDLARRLEEAQPLRQELSRRQALLGPAEQRLYEAQRLAREAEDLYNEVTETSGVMRRLRRLPKPAEQEAAVGQRRGAETGAGQERDQILERLAEAREPLLELEGEARAFEAERGLPLDVIVIRASEAKQAAGRSQAEADARGHHAEALAHDLDSRLEARLAQLRALQLTLVRPDVDAEAAFVAIDQAQAAAATALAGTTRAALQGEDGQLQAQLRELRTELDEIEEALAQVEAFVIAQAMVVATTLTRAYKRDSVQARRFDTVILDEASMAPIPALWLVASLADANVIVVGDPNQLAPIKLAETELADRWLGRDIFIASGVHGRWHDGDPPPHLVQLQVQYRMHPQISAIPNQLVYANSLVDSEGVDEDGDLDGWYRRDWGHDAPVLLVDMEPLNAWVTGVKTGRRGGSRLNFLSATVSVAIAEQLLAEDRPALEPGARPRVLIASPYRPQARLVNLLVKEAGIEREVVPGTAHTFQGSEADVVIFDFVLDEPHRQAGLFDPSRNDTNLRLLNVALTRARKRLIVLGDFSWVERHANPRASLRELVGFLRERYPLASALDVVTGGIQARAAESHRLIAAGEDAPPHKRLVVTQEHYFPLFVRDLDAAQNRVVIFSPFLTPNRVGALEPCLRAAIERGVGVYLVTKTVEERGVGAQEGARTVEDVLRRWGVAILHKFHMHEKLAFIDQEVLWSGSLNTFSFSDTQEVMERRVSREVLVDYARVLRLDSLLAAHEQGEDRCPVCGGELVAAEARNGDPFYWRCLVRDCYTRSLDRPAPREGLLPCSSCGAPVEFRQMPSGPHWRCTVEHRHRQRVAPSHLRLPRMRDLIPRADLARLDRAFAANLAGEQLGLLH